MGRRSAYGPSIVTLPDHTIYVEQESEAPETPATPVVADGAKIVKIGMESDSYNEAFCLGYLTEEGLLQALKAYGEAGITSVQDVESATVQAIVDGKSYYGEIIVSQRVNRGRHGNIVHINEREIWAVEMSIDEVDLYEIQDM